MASLFPREPYSRNEPRVPDVGLRGLLARARLDEHLPVHHRLSRVYRIGAGLMGLFLCVFGVLGVTETIGFLSAEENTVLGLNTNGALSWLSIVVGLALFGGMIKGGNFASTLNMVLGAAFVLSGFVNITLLDTEANILAFRMQNVIFSFVVGLLLLVFGMYGRVSGRLPHDNPYWQARHPGQAEEEQRRRELAERRRRELTDRARTDPAALTDPARAPRGRAPRGRAARRAARRESRGGSPRRT